MADQTQTEITLQSLYKSRNELVALQVCLKKIFEVENFGLLRDQFAAQRESCYLRIRKETDEKKIFRLQGRLDQIEELFSFETHLQNELQSVESRIKQIGKVKNAGNRA